MIKIKIPTSQDVYIEINKKKLAIVEGYESISTRKNRYIESFDSFETVAIVPGKINYILEFSRIYCLDELFDEFINFYDLNNFDVIISKPNKNIKYSGCEWFKINESCKINDSVFENVKISAKKRVEI